MRTSTKSALALAIASLLAFPTIAAATSEDQPSKADQLGAQRRTEGRLQVADRSSSEPSRTRSVAETGCVTDVAGDTEPQPNDPRADVLEVCATHDATVTLDLRPAQFTDPTTDTGWQGVTGLLFDIDANGDEFIDFTVYYFQSFDGSLYGDVSDADGNAICPATPTFDGTTYLITFDRSCIGNPDSLTWQATMLYDSDPNDPDAPVYGDFSPVGGPLAGPAVEPSPSPTSSEHTHDHLAAGDHDHPEYAPDEPFGGHSGPRGVTRLAGKSRYETAVKIAQRAFPGFAKVVYVARADNFPDALAGGALTDGPVLLVPRCGTVPDVVLAEVRRLRPEEVVALGGDGAVCQQVLADVANA